MSSVPAGALHWLGSDAVGLVSTSTIHVYASRPNVTGRLTFVYDAPIVAAVDECDGLRVVTARQHSQLHRVPPALYDVYQISSNAPGAHLLYAYQCYVVGNCVCLFAHSACRTARRRRTSH